MITDVVEGGVRFLTIDDEDELSLKKSKFIGERWRKPGDDHYILHYFSRHFQQPLATVINCLSIIDFTL